MPVHVHACDGLTGPQLRVVDRIDVITPNPSGNTGEYRNGDTALAVIFVSR
jgi:hypothetical protein